MKTIKISDLRTALYNNTDLEFINDESIAGKVKDIKAYLKYGLASFIYKDMSIDELRYNINNILDVLEELENINDNIKITLIINQMGNYYFEMGDK